MQKGRGFRSRTFRLDACAAVWRLVIPLQRTPQDSIYLLPSLSGRPIMSVKSVRIFGVVVPAPLLPAQHLFLFRR